MDHPQPPQLRHRLRQADVVHKDPPRRHPLGAVGRGPVVDEDSARSCPLLLLLRVATDDLEPPRPPDSALELPRAPAPLLASGPLLPALGDACQDLEPGSPVGERIPKLFAPVHELEIAKKALLPLTSHDLAPHVAQRKRLGRLAGDAAEPLVKICEHTVEVAVDGVDDTPRFVAQSAGLQRRNRSLDAVFPWLGVVRTILHLLHHRRAARCGGLLCLLAPLGLLGSPLLVMMTRRHCQFSVDQIRAVRNVSAPASNRPAPAVDRRGAQVRADPRWWDVQRSVGAPDESGVFVHSWPKTGIRSTRSVLLGTSVVRGESRPRT
mmetsp:Transcript_20710/g.40259  ORF Transcript_20710/g.40259 Transcript_20710/m.40259 type:complete len:322 (-) Transcript_20710:301-1266(-)